MSRQNIEAFAEKIARDAGLQERLKALQAKSAKSPQDAIAGLALISAEAGTPVTEAEWEAERLASPPSKASGELSEGDLGAISGGFDLGKVLYDVLMAISPPHQENYH